MEGGITFFWIKKTADRNGNTTKNNKDIKMNVVLAFPVSAHGWREMERILPYPL